MIGLIVLLAVACVANALYARAHRRNHRLVPTAPTGGHHRKPATINVVMAVLAAPAVLVTVVYLAALIIDLVG